MTRSLLLTRRSPLRSTVFLLAGLSATAVSGLHGCASSDTPNDEVGADELNGANAGDAAVQQYLSRHAAAYDAFKYGALATAGVPYVMFRVFPTLLPEVWGAPDDHMKAFGLPPVEPGHTTPPGIGFGPGSTPVPTANGPVTYNVTTATCASCHVGSVVGADGKEHLLIGAPSTTARNLGGAIRASILSPKLTADAFRTALAAIPEGNLYGDPKHLAQERTERSLFMAPGVAEGFIQNLKKSVEAGAAAFAATLGATTYKDQDPSRILGAIGSNDTFAALSQYFVDPTTMTPAEVQSIIPPTPSFADIMDLYNLDKVPRADWDGLDGPHAGYRVANAMMAHAKGKPELVNTTTAKLLAEMIASIPAPSYPFAVDRKKAAAGKKLFGAYCASCHEDATKMMAPSEIGTDPLRARANQPAFTAALARFARGTCSSLGNCDVSDAEIASTTGKYRAVPLWGIWSRAPYLHNGSVPNLRALLVPSSRPATFLRGDTRYDTKNVGFVSVGAASPTTAVFDTALIGNANRGHDTPESLGIDWSKEPGKLDELLEYLKTL